MRPGASPGIPVMATQAELEALGTGADFPPDLTGAAEPVLPAVSFGEGRRPESRTQVQMAEFDGPLKAALASLSVILPNANPNSTERPGCKTRPLLFQPLRY